MQKPPPSTGTVQLCGCALSPLYSGGRSAGRRPVSRAHRSTVLQRQMDERPSLPSARGNPGPAARTFTRCGEMPSRFAMSTAITSSVPESTCTPSNLPARIDLKSTSSRAFASLRCSGDEAVDLEQPPRFFGCFKELLRLTHDEDGAVRFVRDAFADTAKRGEAV